ncbi:unnamed protein product [Bursaphelenchus xylophilus]|uniref:(pine wood nematode) hypothetical protein n=1 Tax=Bursaphelenchus xylophilus TaxID=6326 RepID=A0A1I7S4S2_BURXY|nr:unnamed protein product [Bursaphelenchus xylophilus]CAG9117336.1 unnamed protein product [Bursaphelenchus xylophilus]
MKKPCQICGTETKSVCYKLYICAACTMFYRRNYRLQKELKCRLMNACDLKTSDRRICRACRLKECRALGLRMVGKSLVVQQNGIPEDDMPDEDAGTLPEGCIVSANSPASSTPSRFPEAVVCSTPSTSIAQTHLMDTQHINALNNMRVQLALALNGNLTDNKDNIHITGTKNEIPHLFSLNPTSTIMKAIRLYTQFEERHKRFASLHRLNVPPDVSVTVRCLSYQPIESQIMTFSGYYAIELLEEFGGLSSAEKFSILKGVQSTMIFMHKMFLTCDQYPNLGDSRFAVANGHHFDLKQYAYFLSELESSMTPEELIQQYNRCRVIVEPFFDAIFQACESVRLVMPDPIECAVLLCSCVLEKMEQLRIGAEQSRQFRDALFAEVSVYLGQKYSVQELGTRIMRLTATLFEVKVIAEKYDDMYSLLGVFVADQTNRHPFLQRPTIPADQMKNILAMLNLSSPLTANSLIFSSRPSMALM